MNIIYGNKMKYNKNKHIELEYMFFLLRLIKNYRYIHHTFMAWVYEGFTKTNSTKIIYESETFYDESCRLGYLIYSNKNINYRKLITKIQQIYHVQKIFRGNYYNSLECLLKTDIQFYEYNLWKEINHDN